MSTLSFLGEGALRTILVIVIALCVAAAGTFAVLRSGSVTPANYILFSDEMLRSITTLDGEVRSLREYQNQPFIATTWASWCPQCLDELVLLNELVSAGADVRVLALNRAEHPDQIARYVRSLPELSNVDFAIDSADHFFDSISGFAMPETVVFSRSGEIVYHARGNSDLVSLKEAIRSVASQ